MSLRIKILIWHFEGLDFTRSVDFFQGGSPNKNLEEKNLFHENPVEVRSFDGIEQSIHYSTANADMELNINVSA